MPQLIFHAFCVPEDDPSTSYAFTSLERKVMNTLVAVATVMFALALRFGPIPPTGS